MMDLTTIGKNIIFFGLLIMLTGSVIFFLGKLGITSLKLPGDILIKKDNMTFYFPLVTCLLLSIIFTFIANLFFKK